MNTHSRLLRIKASPTRPEPTPIAAERLLAGTPCEIVENLFTNRQENFFCGVWSSTAGKWTLHYTEDEFCYLLRGKAILTDSDGVVEEINAGDAFVIPAGYRGSWETIAAAQKFYAVYEQG